MTIRLPAVEIAVPDEAPAEGAATVALKVIEQTVQDHRATYTLSAPGGSKANIFVRANIPQVRSDDFPIAGDRLDLQFPNGAGYTNLTLTFHW